jgi:hypothetical protein
MIESGDVLKTWRLDNPPEKLASEKTKATPIKDHDKKFLTYQGPVNNNTATSEIVDEGMCIINNDLSRLLFKGSKLKGNFRFSEDGKTLFLQHITSQSSGFSVIGKLAAFLSLIMIVILSYCYTIKADSYAALTFYPAWCWGLGGLILSFFIRYTNKRHCILMMQLWAVFFFIFAQEPRSLARAFFVSNEDWQSISSEKKLRVVSLNCLAGSQEAMREIISNKPDIILLQETPAKKEILEKFANEIFGDEGEVVWDVDTAVIAKGKLEHIEFSKPKSLFVTQVHAKLKSGIEAEIFSIHLEPPVANINLFSPDCWRIHKDDRQSRRKQIEKITEQLKQIPQSTPIILGGDFNVSANDGCLKELTFYIKDTFNEAGIGWGHTALNTVPLFRIDQIWANKHFKPFAVYAKKTVNSDHRMVISDLMIEN